MTGQWNPLATDATARRLSGYLGPGGDGLARLLDSQVPPTDAEREVHERLLEVVLRPEYPCLGARASVHRRLYRFGLYPVIGSRAAARATCHDLYEFAHELAEPNVGFASFIACFRGPAVTSEEQFEELLWRLLQRMHDLDARFFPWDPQVAGDPHDPAFSFSIGGLAYYVVGLHPAASRTARRFAHPAVVFNLHSQFARLRAQGRLDPLKTAIRARDVALQGSVNPMLDTPYAGSQARQYSGRAVGPDWRCPLHPVSG